MNVTKRAVLGVVLIVGLSAAGGAGTYAFLSDMDESSVSIVTGSLSVQTTPDTMEFGDISEDTAVAQITVTNEGSLPARQVHWTTLSLSGDTVVAEALVIESIEYRGQDVTDKIKTKVSGHGNGNGVFDLHDIRLYLADGQSLDLESMVSGDGLDADGAESAELEVSASVDYSQEAIDADNMSVTATVEVTGKQSPANGTWTGGDNTTVTPVSTSNATG